MAQLGEASAGTRLLIVGVAVAGVGLLAYGVYEAVQSVKAGVSNLEGQVANAPSAAASSLWSEVKSAIGIS
jgi:hypothetical protein